MCRGEYGSSHDLDKRRSHAGLLYTHGNTVHGENSSFRRNAIDDYESHSEVSCLDLPTRSCLYPKGKPRLPRLPSPTPFACIAPASTNSAASTGPPAPRPGIEDRARGLSAASYPNCVRGKAIQDKLSENIQVGHLKGSAREWFTNIGDEVRRALLSASKHVRRQFSYLWRDPALIGPF